MQRVMEFQAELLGYDFLKQRFYSRVPNPILLPVFMTDVILSNLRTICQNEYWSLQMIFTSEY